ncbi:MAG: cysteine desulfurase family protein [Rhodomicrobium sp.]
MMRSYLDHNATSPLRSEARDAMTKAFGCAGNPSSVHKEGREARSIVESARETVASVFGVEPDGVFFTSGGTEAANWLLQPCETRMLLLSPTEHDCVLTGHRFEPDCVRFIPVSSAGILDLAALQLALAPGSLIAAQAANNETGVLQPLEDIGRLARDSGSIFVCDAVQAIGRVPISSLAHADVLLFSAHKFGGPKGVGAAIFREKSFTPWPLLRGGGQERRQRSGTENVPGIAGLGAALEAAVGEQKDFSERAATLRDVIESGLRSIAPDVVIFGEKAERLPNTTCFAVPGMKAESLLISLDLEGVSVSSGSACSSGKVERSHVLEAMGVPKELSAGAIRVSTGWSTTEEEVERFLSAFSEICGSRQGRRAA